MMRYQRGFTLLEMVLVLFLLGMMASATVLLTDGLSDQASCDETKRRMALIRTAILGDTSRTINGSPEISGFVADMGRLPLCLAELIHLGEPIPVPIPVPVTGITTEYKSPCADYELGSVSDDLRVSVWQIDENTGLGHGWRGPYLQVLPDSDGVSRFRDGYGNTATNADGLAGTNTDATTTGDDERNYGWTWKLYNLDKTVTVDTGGVITTSVPDEITYPYTDDITSELETNKVVTLRIQSFGLDGSDDPLHGKYPTGDITNDEWFDKNKTLIKSSEWKINEISVVFKNINETTDLPDASVSASLDLILRIYRYSVDSSSQRVVDDHYISSDILTLNSGYVKKNGTATPPLIFNFDDNNDISQGNLAYVVVCNNIPSSLDEDDYVFYDGDCNPTNVKIDSSLSTPLNLDKINYFSLPIIKGYQPRLEWVIQ